MLYATNVWLPAFDNVSYLSKDMSDNLCRITTGAGFGTRKHFTNDEEFTVDVRRPIMLNGIVDVITRGDLLNRTITLHLPVINPAKRKTEKFVEAKSNGYPL